MRQAAEWFLRGSITGRMASNAISCEIFGGTGGRKCMKSEKASISEYQKASEYLSAERTFLAWMRTSISVITLGFVVAKFGVWLRELSKRLQPGAGGGGGTDGTGLSLPIGVAMMAVGAILAILAVWHYHIINKAIERGEVRVNRAMVISVALSIACIAVVMIIYMLVAAQEF
jgi:putative membrane protein